MAMSAKASDDIAWLPATAQLAVLAAKKVSSAELVELYLSRIDTYNASLNAIVTVDPDAARRVAKRSDAARARGDELGPLHGLPITVKDSYETAGMRTTCGRRDLADYVPTQDAEAVARLRRAGAIIMGKTNMPTGNQDVQASNPVFGRTNNPWDAARTSGGSAGGGAAATAAGLTSFDYGSEIGGSRQQLKADDAGVVEGNDDGLRYPLGVPEGFDEIRALEGRVRVIPGFVGVAVADVVQVDAGEVESRAQESFHLRPTVGTIRPARQERSRDPRPSSAPYERAQRRTWVDARPLSVVAHPLPSGEPLLCADERARPVRHRALASRWRRLSRSMSVHLRNQSTPISLRVALTDVQCRL